MQVPRSALPLVALVAVVVIGWLAWAWLSGGFCSPPPGAACL